MAMEKRMVLKEIHKCTCSAIGFHPVRRELVAGFEDGSMKWWDQEGGKLMLYSTEHTGWVTDFIFIQKKKLFLSCAHDGIIIVWGTGAQVLERIKVGSPIYTLTHNIRRNQLVLGLKGTIMLYWLDLSMKATSVIHETKPCKSHEHTDIVSCVVCYESRVYSAGYDSRMCIYDTTLFPGKMDLSTINKNNHAHEAGITCMTLISDNENNRWILTGSFDASVKVWSQDGQLRQRFSTPFYDTITSICYLPRNRIVWIASVGINPVIFDPKSGENVTEFMPTFQPEHEEYPIFNRLVRLRQSPETGQIFGVTSCRHLILWKYNCSGCSTILRMPSAVGSIAYTRKAPLLFFSGCADGNAFKWERAQSSMFMYSVDQLNRKESLDKQEAILSNKGELSDEVSNMYLNLTSRKPSLPKSLLNNQNVSLSCSLFLEKSDLLILACDDGKIYVWGFDSDGIHVLEQLAEEHKARLEWESTSKYNFLRSTPLLPPQPPMDKQLMVDQSCSQVISTASAVTQSQITTVAPSMSMNTAVTGSQTGNSANNRVAGFICKNVLIGHSSCVSSIVIIDNPALYDRTFLLSGSWDRRLLIWDLDENGKYYDQLRYPGTKFGCIPDGTFDDGGMFACDGNILAMEYCHKRNEIAYASSDNIVYIRHFSNDGSLMHLRCTLEGHEQEISAVKWNPVYEKWVTASEDGIIKIWAEDGSCCENTMIAHGLVSTFCIDKLNGNIVAAVDNEIKVFDSETSILVQRNLGHTENIRCISHIVERGQYMSGSYDMTMRVWNAYRKPPKKEENDNPFKIRLNKK